MTTYRIEQTATAVILFEGEAKDEQHALDLMAQDAGYEDYAHLPTEVGGGETLMVSIVWNGDSARRRVGGTMGS